MPFVLTPYSNNKFNSLASLLKVKGYHTSFFIGHPNGAMGYTAFTKMAGYDNYFGLDEYGKSEDSDGIWGIWDHKFLPFFANQLNEFPQPFFSTLFTVSSHHPFVVPKEFEGKFKGGDLSILKCIEYTDYSLRELFKKISKEPWYKNTLFVFTADHASSEVIFEESHANAGLYAVPIIFFKPDNSLAEYRHEIAQQIDIMPTVLGYLHYDKPYVAFGRDLFREKSKPVAFNYRDAYYFYRDQYALSFDGKKTLGLYNFTTDTYFKENLLSQKGDVVGEMETQLKAIIQQYNNRLVGNKLTVD